MLACTAPQRRTATRQHSITAQHNKDKRIIPGTIPQSAPPTLRTVHACIIPTYRHTYHLHRTSIPCKYVPHRSTAAGSIIAAASSNWPMYLRPTDSSTRGRLEAPLLPLNQSLNHLNSSRPATPAPTPTLRACCPAHRIIPCPCPMPIHSHALVLRIDYNHRVRLVSLPFLSPSGFSRINSTSPLCVLRKLSAAQFSHLEFVTSHKQTAALPYTSQHRTPTGGKV